MSKIKIESNWIVFNGRKCGYIENRMYVTERNPRDHFYVMGGGYPIANDILHWLKEHSINSIKIIEKRKAGIRIWFATVDQYLKAVLVQHEPFESQRCIPLNQLYDYYDTQEVN